MLSFNDEDFNLKLICSRLRDGLEEFKIKNYYVYGLKHEADRPHLMLKVKAKTEIPPELLKLFDRSKIKVSVEPAGKKYNADVMIGIRKDVRENVQFSKNLIKTIIFAIEGKLILEPNFIITHTLGE